MSLILEALRKSEQQRRLGQSPTLVSESAWAARRAHGPPVRGMRWLWLLLSVLLLAVASAVAWYAGRQQAAPQDVAVQQPALPVTPTVPDPAPTAASTAPAASAAPPMGAAPLAQPAPLPQGPEDMLAPSEGLDPAVRAQVEQGTLVPNHPQLLRPQPPTPAPQYVPPEAALPQALAEVDAAAAPATPQVAAPPEPAPMAAVAPVQTQAPAAATANGGLPYAYELPLATRQTLPAMKVTMHVWNADPARRFVILDAVRAGEGQPAGETLTVIEIRRDGVVLDFHGTRFLLPNSGY